MSGRINQEALGITPELGAFAELVGFTVADESRTGSLEQEIAAINGVAFALAALDLAGALRPDISVEEIEEAFSMTVQLFNDAHSLAYLRDLAASRYKSEHGVDTDAAFAYPDSSGMYEDYHNRAHWDAARSAGFTEDEVMAHYTKPEEDVTERDLAAKEYFDESYYDPALTEQAKKQVARSKIAGWLQVLVGGEPIEEVDQSQLLRSAMPGNLTPDAEGLRYMRQIQAADEDEV